MPSVRHSRAAAVLYLAPSPSSLCLFICEICGLILFHWAHRNRPSGHELNRLNRTIISFHGFRGRSTIWALKRRDRGGRERVFPILWAPVVGTVGALHHCRHSFNFER